MIHRKNTLRVGMAALFLAIACRSGIWADESPFGYIYTAESMPKGHWEYEQWNTARTGKAAGSYAAFDLRNELEYGFTDRFQASLYINSSYLHSKDVPDPDDATLKLDNQSAFDVNGLSIELKYQVLSPYKCPLGLSLYIEPELAARNPLSGSDTAERALESKLILQKNLMDDRLVLASNIVFEPEWERQNGDRSKELKSEYSIGASYRLAPGWFGGLELLNRRKFNDQDFAKQGTSAFFLGPAVHYAAKEWWMTLTVLPQIAGNPHSLGFDANGNEISDGSRTLGEYEKMEIRFRFGIEF
jgi:uncharacterized protein DUF6662